MKQKLHHNVFLFFLLFLLCSSKLSARPMTSKQGYEKVNLNQMATKDSLVQMEGSEIVDLMGSEVCQSGDEECFKRRMVLEAHLDYIYTQHHKP